VEELSSDCNHAMWLYRKEITGENGFTQLTKDICFDDFQKTGCWNTSVVAQPGFNLVTCIIDFKDRLEKLKCQRLITRLEGVIFADYEVIGRFADKCAGDIQKFVCGRNDISVQSQAQRVREDLQLALYK
jgi:Golgi apparatus protein 1